MKAKPSSLPPPKTHHFWTRRVFELSFHKLEVSEVGAPAVVTVGFSFYQNSGCDLLGIGDIYGASFKLLHPKEEKSSDG